jgi:2-polyprenyl-3-methyl-5-hydroxy-6-metoxy-1,4-benzoquinol methylase
MRTKQSMDLFGEALKAYYLGDKSKFYLKEPSGKMSEHSLKRYFRKISQLSKLERKLISLSYGEILDVGCGTGNYMSLLAKRGKVLGFDISQNVIDAAKMSGCKNCIVADIFTFSENKKYDTITFLENNLGIGGTIDKTRKLLRKISILLKDNGQILAISRNLRNKDYFSIELKPV